MINWNENCVYLFTKIIMRFFIYIFLVLVSTSSYCQVDWVDDLKNERDSILRVYDLLISDYQTLQDSLQIEIEKSEMSNDDALSLKLTNDYLFLIREEKKLLKEQMKIYLIIIDKKNRNVEPIIND